MEVVIGDGTTRRFGPHLDRQLYRLRSRLHRSRAENPATPSTTLSAQGCHPCLRYVPLPMSPVPTMDLLLQRTGFEPPAPGVRTSRLTRATSFFAELLGSATTTILERDQDFESGSLQGMSQVRTSLSLASSSAIVGTRAMLQRPLPAPKTRLPGTRISRAEKGRFESPHHKCRASGRSADGKTVTKRSNAWNRLGTQQ
jgi:hypothetical protein